MFSIFAPKLPVRVEYAEWIDQSMQRLGTMFNIDSWSGVQMILPTPEFFPEGWVNDSEAQLNASAEAVLARCCSYMGIDPRMVELELQHEDVHDLANSLPAYESNEQGAAGLYSANIRADEGKAAITIKLSRRSDPVSIVATISHELAHVLLLGGAKISHDVADMEPFTDLATVALGFGLFGASSAFQFEQHDDGQKQGWSVKRLGYLSEPLWAYALARFAKLRGEPRPRWNNYMNVNIRTYFKQSADWISRNG